MFTKTLMGDKWVVNGSVSANFHQVILDENGNELARSNPHTICLSPDANFDTTIAAVNADITTRMKWKPIANSDWDNIAAHCAVEFTPEIKAAYAKFKSEQ